MKVISVLKCAGPAGEAAFAVDLASDGGGRWQVTASGQQLDCPAGFAAFAQAETGEACTPPTRDRGAWHAVLGQLLARNAGQGATSNLSAGPARPASGTAGKAEADVATFDDGRRRELLAATALGRSVPAGPAPAAEPERPEALSEQAQFVLGCQEKDEAARRERLAKLAPHMGCTQLGRDILKQGGIPQG
jgi:hypothetical protein